MNFIAEKRTICSTLLIQIKKEKIMLNIRTIILSIVLVAILMLTAGLVSVKREIASNTTNAEAESPGSQEQSADQTKPYNVLSYRSQFGQCIDVSIQELATCIDTNQNSMKTYRPPLDECFDVPLTDIAGCRDESQAPSQLYRSPVDECFDVPLTEAFSCRNESQTASP